MLVPRLFFIWLNTHRQALSYVASLEIAIGHRNSHNALSDNRALLVLHEDEQTGRRLHQELAEDFAVYVAAELDAARLLLADRSIRVLVVSRAIVAASGPAFLELLSSEFPRITPIVVGNDRRSSEPTVHGDGDADISGIAANVRLAFSKLGEDAVLSSSEEIDRAPNADAAPRSDVYGTAAHDLRNPLSVILSLTELMLHEASLGPAEMQQFLEAIRTNAGEMHRLLDDVQEISRFESGRSETRPQDTEVRSLLEDAVADATVAKIASIAVGDAEATWMLDRDQMRRALALLIADAAARARDAVSVRASFGGDVMVIRIADDGAQLDHTALKEITDSLRRGRRRSAEVAVGTGLGPALAARIIEAHNGTISVASMSRETIVEVRLPRHA